MITFEKYIKKNKPQYAYLVPRIAKTIGKQPEWQDLTKSTLITLKNEWLRDLSANTVRTHLAVIKSVMNQVKDDIELPKNFADGMKVRKEATMSVYLTEEEIERLQRHRFRTNNDKFAQAMFLLQYYTGSRYSDATNLTHSNIVNGQLSYVTQKTKVVVTIPAKLVVAELISTLEGLRTPAKRTYLYRLKDICNMAGIRDEVKVFQAGRSIIGGKWRFVGSHTARRSFATNLLLRGADLYTISKLMGHATTEMTMRYICSQVVLDDASQKFFL